MDKLKNVTKVVLVLLCIGSIATLFMGGFMPMFSVAFGILFLYYILVYLVIIFIKKNRLNCAIAYLLFIFPILWAIMDWEGLLDVLLDGIHLDMK
ncbi:hypothetical protein PY092_03515 [Muricauda sp. 334s03]|uniref:Apolipoprotein N-acyltransferase n=1 Tax=Flagellimonas yonaguniensis TaxID=3031325 RepID=A0ABT5XVJ0_9FLAO|nr:hypothetical protein [[Muricauda] yonaguniensis]MDF0715208.1 hypothetical protein [[Muricauda] yonaguniensis]